MKWPVYLILAGALGLAPGGCSEAPAADIMSAPAPAPRPAPAAPPPASVSPPPAPAADKVLHDSAEATAQASRYVAWRASKPANIDRLTDLTGRVQAAVGMMQAGRQNGHYNPAHVATARRAVDELRSFLANKDD